MSNDQRAESADPDALKASAQRVQDTLIARGFANRVIELDASTRTAAAAAAAVGCMVGQIAKSLIFSTAKSGGKQDDGEGPRAILVIASGSNRVDTKRLAQLVGEALVRPDAEFVREQTGFAIGGIPPLGHVSQAVARPLETWIDADLLQYEEIWAAAGHPNAVFRLTPGELLAITSGTVADFAQR